MAIVDFVVAMLLIATSWVLLSRALARSVRSEIDALPSSVIESLGRGEFPAPAGPINGTTTRERSLA